LTTLGVNTLNFAVPALICYYLFNYPLRHTRRAGPTVFFLGCAAGMLGMCLSAIVFAAALLLSGGQWWAAVIGILGLHLPVILVEGLVTGSVVVSLKRIRPEVFEGLAWARVRELPHA
jgi:cobalt/nickel transport system permease protein